MSTRTAVLAAALVIVVSPLVGAWGGKGGHEPDTRQDKDSGWMYGTPDASPTGRKVYFHGWEGHQGSFNPNAATLQSRVSGQQYAFYALLGVWKDCNRDGYVGLGDQGLAEYRAELLVDTSVCRVGTVPNPIPLDWAPPHNDGKWVHELMQIGWYSPFSYVGDVNPFNLNDNGSRVWADYGLPGVAPPGIDCTTNPPPRGSTRSTGGLLFWLDCPTGYRVTDNFSVLVEAAGHRELSFSDHPRDQYNSASQLNRPNPWGRESDGSYAQAWDCSRPQVYSVQLDNTTHYNVSYPRIPPGVSTTGSAAGTMNATGSGFDECRRYDRAPDQHNHPGRTLANQPYSLEGAAIQSAVKRAATGTMVPDEYTRPAAPYAALLGASTPSGPTPNRPSDDLGVGLTSRLGFWYDGVSRSNEGPLVDTARGSVSGVQRVTYYAYVSPTAVTKYGLSLPKAGPVGVYGSETCAGAATGVINGWDCDGAAWYRDALGGDVRPRSRYLGRDFSLPATYRCDPPTLSNIGSYTTYGTADNSRGCLAVAPVSGSPYNLRDVDCYDQSAAGAREAGAQWGILTGTTC